MGTMNILDKTGDIELGWNPDNRDEVKQAEKTFDENKKKGFTPFRVYDDGKKGEQLDKFDKFAERILFVPAMAGG